MPREEVERKAFPGIGSSFLSRELEIKREPAKCEREEERAREKGKVEKRDRDHCTALMQFERLITDVQKSSKRLCDTAWPSSSSQSG